MTNDNPNRRSVIVSTIAAGLLVLALGLTHRILAARLSTPLSNIPINPAALDDFQLQIHDWMGEDVPMDETILDKINAEASINRLYSRDNRAESISLFIAASGVTAGTMVGHPPEICNVRSGYQLLDQRYVELMLESGTKLPCTILQFSRGGSLIQERKTVLYYYMADEQFCGDRSVLRSKVRRGPSMVNCIAQVQIVASSRGTQPADSATKLVSDFAVDSAPSIAQLMEYIKKDQSTGAPQTLQEEGYHR